MLIALPAVGPVFAVIAAGYLCGWLRLLGTTASSELSKFVVNLALPSLLFEVMAEADLASLWQPGFVAAFTTGSLVIFGATLVFRMRRGQHLTDATLDGLNAGYANTGYIGFPLCELVFGRQSFALVTISTVATACVLFALAIVLVEIGLQTEARTLSLVPKVGKALARNPLLIAPVLGLLCSGAGLHLPAMAKTFFHMLGGSASPCALVSLGLFLAARGPNPLSEGPALAFTGLKLVVQPVLTGLLAYLLRLPAETTGVAVLMSALPTGTGPFILAEFYDREAVTTSGTILISTVVSVVSLTACILLLRSLGLV